MQDVQHTVDFPDVRPPPSSPRPVAVQLQHQPWPQLSVLLPLATAAAADAAAAVPVTRAGAAQISKAEFVDVEVEAGPGQLVLSVELFALTVSEPTPPPAAAAAPALGNDPSAMHAAYGSDPRAPHLTLSFGYFLISQGNNLSYASSGMGCTSQSHRSPAFLGLIATLRRLLALLFFISPHPPSSDSSPRFDACPALLLFFSLHPCAHWQHHPHRLSPTPP